MRVNVYAEEMTTRVEIVEKTTPDGTFTGLRLYLELPVTVPVFDREGNQVGQHNYSGPFIHHGQPVDDDSSAITFWGKSDLRIVVDTMKAKLEEYYASKAFGEFFISPPPDDAIPL